jgi:hypothetical protein
MYHNRLLKTFIEFENVFYKGWVQSLEYVEQGINELYIALLAARYYIRCTLWFFCYFQVLFCCVRVYMFCLRVQL